MIFLLLPTLKQCYLEKICLEGGKRSFLIPDTQLT